MALDADTCLLGMPMDAADVRILFEVLAGWLAGWPGWVSGNRAKEKIAKFGNIYVMPKQRPRGERGRGGASCVGVSVPGKSKGRFGIEAAATTSNLETGYHLVALLYLHLSLYRTATSPRTPTRPLSSLADDTE